MLILTIVQSFRISVFTELSIIMWKHWKNIYRSITFTTYVRVHLQNNAANDIHVPKHDNEKNLLYAWKLLYLFTAYMHAGQPASYFSLNTWNILSILKLKNTYTEYKGLRHTKHMYAYWITMQVTHFTERRNDLYWLPVLSAFYCWLNSHTEYLCSDETGTIAWKQKTHNQLIWP